MEQHRLQLVAEVADKSQDHIVGGLLQALLPGDTDHGVPGAIEINLLHKLSKDIYWDNQVKLVIAKVVELVLNGELLDEQRLNRALEEYSRNKPRMWFAIINPILGILLTYYYSDEGVRQALGIKNISPFPSGSRMQDTDLVILSPVYERGKIYRDPSTTSKSYDQ